MELANEIAYELSTIRQFYQSKFGMSYRRFFGILLNYLITKISGGTAPLNCNFVDLMF